VKFFERQKLTRLEKSVKRQLQQLQNDGGDVDQAAQLQKQLLFIGLDQLTSSSSAAEATIVYWFGSALRRIFSCQHEIYDFISKWSYR